MVIFTKKTKKLQKTRNGYGMIQTFQNKPLPSSSSLVGYAWLIAYFKLTIPLSEPSAISQKRLSSQRVQHKEWVEFDSQFEVKATPYAHLEFTIKHEKLNLLLLKTILKLFSVDEIIANIQSNPKRILNKKIWFYYEFLLEERLPIEDLSAGKYDELLSSKKYITRKNPIKSKRHKINNNLLGSAKLCPIIQRTKTIEAYLSSDLSSNISTIINSVSKSLIRRASSFLLLADSQASFEIEGDRVTRNRIENWSKIINQAGKIPLSIKEIERLHAILLDNSRFIKIGLRQSEVFLGDRDRENRPIPQFIGAKSEDLKVLMEDWLELHTLLSKEQIEPVLHATILAFSFVYIHPLEDGNGRIHRYLLHHILAQRDFYPKGMIFPISSVILDEIEQYQEVLVSHTLPLMSMIEWEATQHGNVKILNNTIDLYRFFDITKSCEFIYGIVEKTIKETLPSELKYLSSFDKASYEINEIVAMPNNMIKSLITFILQNNGKLSKKKKSKYFEELTMAEVEEIESVVISEFHSFISSNRGE